MSRNYRIAFFWAGLILLLIITTGMTFWLGFLIFFLYGFFTSIAGYYAFPFQYKDRT